MRDVIKIFSGTMAKLVGMFICVIGSFIAIFVFSMPEFFPHNSIWYCVGIIVFGVFIMSIGEAIHRR